jgi:hypothetical protein
VSPLTSIDPQMWWLLASGLAAGAAVLVLPGLALLGATDLVRRRRAADGPETLGPGDTAAAAALLSLALVGLVGVVLIGVGGLSPGSLAVPVGVLAVAGVVVAARGALHLRTRAWLSAGVVVLASAPMSASLLDGGYKPAHSYQWFYWGLGRQLSTAGGVPEHVLEWGREVRWQPDYLEFNLLTQAFLGLTPHLSDPVAVTVWRLPTTLLAVGMLFLVLRLWFPVLPATVALLAFVATDFFVQTVGNNAPEGVGLALGLAAVRLGVSGVRRGRGGLVLLAFLGLALDVNVHGVAATVCGLVLLAALVVELPASRAGLRRWLPTLTVAGVAGAVVLVAQGMAVQGRSSPLGDAANPRRSDSGADPTYDFTRFSNGRFDEPIKRNGLHDALLSPWPGHDLVSWQWGWLGALALVGLVAAVLVRRGLPARGVAVSVVLAALVTGAVLWFQLRYDTYVPQHTGNDRIAGYYPLVLALWVAAGAQALGLLARRLRARPVWVTGALAAVVLVVTAPQTYATMAGRPTMGTDGQRALTWMAENLPPGSRVVSDVATRGTVEFFTGAENPLEGRQPLIEDGGFLDAAIDQLLAVHDFLENPAPGGLEALGADYLVVAPPGELGTGLSYGNAPGNVAARAGLETVYDRGGVKVFRATASPVAVDPVGPAKSLGGPVVVALAIIAVTLLGAVAALRRLGSRVEGTRA